MITGCLKPTPLKYIYPLAGIASPGIRRYVATCIGKTKQLMDPKGYLNLEEDLLLIQPRYQKGSFCPVRTYYVNVAKTKQSTTYYSAHRLVPPGCTTDDLALANEKAISIATHWLKQNI